MFPAISSPTLKGVWRSRWLAPVFLLAFVALLGAEAIFGRTFIIPTGGAEILFQWLPYRLFFRAVLRNSELPLWSHHLLAGFPLAAFIHAGAFYPFNLLFCLLEYGTASTFYHLLHLVVQAWFMYGFLREEGVSKTSALLISAASSVTGPFYYRMGVAHDFVTLAWLPAVFWFSLRLCRRRRLRDLLALATALALFLLAGNIEIALFALLTLFIFIWHQSRGYRTLLPAAGLVLASLLVAYQLLLTAAFLPHSYRHFHPASTAGYSLQNLYLVISFLVFLPSWPGSNEAFFAYFGFVPLLGIFLDPGTAEAKRRKNFFLVFGLLAFLYMLNPWPLSLLFDRLPLLNRFSSPDIRYRIMFGPLLLGFLVAGHGLDRGIQQAEEANPRRPLLLTIFFLAAQAVWLIAGWTAHHGLFLFALSRLILVVTLVAFLIRLYLMARSGHSRPSLPGPAWLFLLLFLDVFTLALEALPRSGKEIYAPESAQKIFAAERSPDRLLLTSTQFQDLPLLYLFRLDRGPGRLMGYIRNGLNRYQELAHAMSGDRGRDHEEQINFFDPAWLEPRNRPLLDFLAVRYVVARKEVTVPPDFLVRAEGLFRFFENPSARPRYQVYPRARFMPEDKILSRLLSPVFSADRDLMVEASAVPPETLSESGGGASRVQVLEYGEGRVQLLVETEGGGWLCAAEPYYPGWRAWVNGREVRIFRANYAFQALPLPGPGTCQVLLQFLPTEFRIGLWAAIASFAFFGLSFYWSRNRPGLPVANGEKHKK